MTQVRTRLAALIAAALPLTATILPAPAAAQMVVYDPAVHAESVLSAARALEQIRHQIAAIEQQARMLERNQLDLSPELTQSIRSARDLFTEAESLAFDIGRIASDIEALYPETWEAYDLESVRAQSQRWRAASRASLARAMEAEARAAKSIDDTGTRLQSALGASQGAEGQTGAIQAGNQLQALSAAQLAEIHSLLVVQGRALQTERMERLAREERAEEIQRRAFPAKLPAPSDPARSAF
jgi:P-type conjugative transfer protein TrbJ